jgi:hypothetical protein
LAFGGSSYRNATEEYDGSAWSAGGNLNIGRQVLAGAGTQTAGLAFGGQYLFSRSSTEEYDGTSWSNGGNMGTGRRFLAGAGTQSAGLAIGGYINDPSDKTEEYTGGSPTTTTIKTITVS